MMPHAWGHRRLCGPFPARFPPRIPHHTPYPTLTYTRHASRAMGPDRGRSSLVDNPPPWGHCYPYHAALAGCKLTLSGPMRAITKELS